MNGLSVERVEVGKQGVCGSEDSESTEGLPVSARLCAAGGRRADLSEVPPGCERRHSVRGGGRGNDREDTAT